MDKRALCRLFADRLRQVVEREAGGVGALARATGLDRSALSQFMAPGATRLPRAEALRRLAEHAGVTTDWLLGLSFSDEGERALQPSLDIEAATNQDGDTPIARWHREAAGHKIRYVPSLLPDQLSFAEVLAHSIGGLGQSRLLQAEASLSTVELGETDLEIAMPEQTLADLAVGSGVWTGLGRNLRREQLLHMASLTETHYPVLRLHLYDARRVFAAPFTVFGPLRAALYLGPSYLVLTGAEDVRRIARIFDGLVREAMIGPDRVSSHLAALASSAR
ncbi:MAG: transcriptional regulator [Pseudomonadota bacterium]